MAELAEMEAVERDEEAAERAALYRDEASSIILCDLPPSAEDMAELAEATTAARLAEANDEACSY